MVEIRDKFVDITLDGTKHQIVRGLYQFDHGLKIRIAGVESEDTFQIQYSCVGQNNALTVMSQRDGDIVIADIPDAMQMQAKEIMCYIYLEKDSSGVTVYEIAMPVMPRARPMDSSYTPEQINNYDQLVAELNTLIEETTVLKESLEDLDFYVNQEDGCLYQETPF